MEYTFTMKIEYEATFPKVDKGIIRKKLRSIGAVLARPEFTQVRKTFNLPVGHEIKGGWLRVRDEGDKITLSLKVVDGSNIENQKETQLKVDDFNNACSLLGMIGCGEKALQETKRELWVLGNTEITIDEWPFLEPFVEIEGVSEQEVREVADKLDFDWSKAKFCSIDTLYAEKYGITEDRVNYHTPRIAFDMTNPFIVR